MADFSQKSLIPEEVMALVLAGGKGLRMGSDQPKALRMLRGLPFLEHVLRALKGAGIESQAVVVGNHHEKCFDAFFQKHPEVGICLQDAPLGTAHAVGCGGYFWDHVAVPDYARGSIRKTPQEFCPTVDSVLICLGDVPGLCPQVLRDLIQVYRESKSEILITTMEVPNPTGYGRVLVDGKGQVERIIEERHADEEQKKIALCFTGVMMARIPSLFAWLSRLKAQEGSGEYYLTDVLPEAYRDGAQSGHYLVPSWQPFMGLNTPQQLGEMERFLSR